MLKILARKITGLCKLCVHAEGIIIVSVLECFQGFVSKSWTIVRLGNWRLLVLQKGHFNFSKLPLNWILLSVATLKTSLILLGHCSLKYLKTIELTHCLNSKVMVNQFKHSNYSWDICFKLSNHWQKRIHLFWVVWILCFIFFVRFGYQAEHA